MSKSVRSEGVSLQYRRDMNMSTPSGTASQVAAGGNDSHFFQIDTAEVIDVIYNPNHTDFVSGADIGKIKVRLTKEGKGTEETEIPWMYPINPYLIQYPVKHEVVYIIKIVGKYYYLGNVSAEGNINNNIIPGISSTPVAPNDDNTDSYKSTQTTTPNTTGGAIELGDTFVDNNKKVKPLLPNEGDVIVRGRFGNNIRFGNNPETNSPNMKVSVGQSPTVNSSEPLTHYVEDINETPTSIWATTDEIIEIKPITKGSSYYLKSAKSPPTTFDKVQLIFNTDRVIWNAKKNEILMFANKGIALNTHGYIALDCQDTFGITTLDKLNIAAKNGIFVDAPKIILGKDAREPLVLGDKLVQILGELIDAIVQETHPTGAGQSGPPVNSAAFKIIKNKLARTILSKQNKTL